MTSTWTVAASPALSFLMPSGIARLSWSEQGRNDALLASGKLDLNELALGGIDVSQPLSATLLKTQLSGDLKIPIKVDLPAAKGSISFLNGDQNVTIQGRLDRLAIDGLLVVPVADISSSHFEAGPNKVSLAVGAAISVSPVIAGAKANFLNAELAVSNETALHVARINSQGTTLLSSDILVLTQPVFKLGDNGTAHQATLDLSAEGKATLQYDIGTRRVGLAQAKLHVHDVTFFLLGNGEKTIDLGGTLVTDPTVSLKDLLIEVDQLSPTQAAFAQLDTLSVGATRISKARAAGSATGLVYSGAPTKPLTLTSAHAAQVKVGDEIAFSDFDIAGLNFAANNASVDFGGGVTLSHGQLSLSVGDINEEQVLGNRTRQVKAADISACGQIGINTPAFSVNGSVPTVVALTLDGPEDALNGAGTVGIGGFSGDARSVLTVNYDCRDTSHLDVDMEADFAVGGAVLNAKMRNGRLSGDAATGPIGVNIHNTNPASCDAPSVHHVIQAKGKYWTDGLCNRGWAIYECRWESPEIGYSYHIALNIRLLTASALLSNPHLYLTESGNLQVCNVGVMALTNVVAIGGYTPAPETTYPGLDNIVNGTIQFTLEPAQSLFATSIGDGVGWLVTGAGSLGGNVFCLGKAL